MLEKTTERSIAELDAVAKVCSSAPADLLEYRRLTFGHARTADLIGEAKSALAAEHIGRQRFDGLFYLDALPPVSDIKSSVAALRRKDGFFAFFDAEWRKARRLHASISREKRKLTAKQRAEELAALALERQARLRSVEGLDLRFLIAAQHQGMLGRIDTGQRCLRACR